MTAIRTALVVGGGIVGLTAAAALARAGVAVTLIERKPEIGDDGGIGMGLQSNAMAALDRIGVAEACLAEGLPIDHLHIHAPGGDLLARPPVPRNGGPRWPGFVGISRPTLHRLLVAEAERAGVQLLAGVGLVTLEDRADAIAVGLSDGRIVDADLLVAADGVNSAVRRLLFPDHADPRATGEAVWRARVGPSAALDFVALTHGGGVGTVGCTPISNGEGYLYAVDRAERAPARDEPDLAGRFRDLLHGYCGWPERLIPHLAGEVSYRPLETVLLPSPWYRGRAVVIGDAAHAGPPTLAQGAAMGIEDAVVLAECLGGEDDVHVALELFMRRRYDRVRTVVEASLAISSAQMRPDGAPVMAEAQQRAAAVLAEPF